MESEKVVPTEVTLKQFELDDPDTLNLIHQAQVSDAADHELILFAAFKKYKKAVLWSCLLSTALIMEGYDVVIVRRLIRRLTPLPLANLRYRSTPFSVNRNSRLDLGP